MMRKIFFGISVALTAVLLFLPVAFANEIEISPVAEGQEYTIMKPGEIQTFEAHGFGWDKNTQQKIPGASIETIQWNFNPGFLELVNPVREQNSLPTSSEAFSNGADGDIKPPSALRDASPSTSSGAFSNGLKNTGNTITLRALKRRTSKLTVTGKINGKPVTRTIFIVVKGDKGGNK